MAEMLGFKLKDNHSYKEVYLGTSLVVQWLGVCLPVQGMWVWALVWEDPTCREANRPVRHSC